MVGTSIFENYFEEEKDETVKGCYDNIKNIRSSQIENERSRANTIEKAIKKWIEDKKEKDDVSAEIKSLVKLKEELRDDFEIYLLSSDTILSKLAGEIIKGVLRNNESFANANINLIAIAKLQIWDRKEFNEGMASLISEIYKIAQEYWENVIINITGGYKATIPYLTILAQINKCPVYYIFEDTDSLIKIPNIPLSQEWFDWDQLEQYESDLYRLDNGITEQSDYQRLINSDFYRNYSFLIWEEIPLAELNPIGRIIFNKYKEKIFKFYTTQEVISKLEGDSRLKKLFQSKFSNKNTRNNKKELKKGHFVYDDGDNQLRIFYIERNNEVYVYEAFNNHDEYKRYLENTPFSENILNTKNFTEYKIKKEG